MSKRPSHLRGKGRHVGYGYRSTELNAIKGSLPYARNLQDARQSEVTKQYFSQKRMSAKVTGAKYARLVKLAKYQMFVDRVALK